MRVSLILHVLPKMSKKYLKRTVIILCIVIMHTFFGRDYFNFIFAENISG